VIYLHYMGKFTALQRAAGGGGGGSIPVRRLKRTVFPAKNVGGGGGGGGELPINCSGQKYRSLPRERAGGVSAT
jgi:hypothetical protein